MAQEEEDLTDLTTKTPRHREVFGVPEGTPGRVIVLQTNLLMTAFKGATADGFPAERVEINAVGK